MVSYVLCDICYFVLPLKSWLSIGEWASVFYQILWLPCSCSGLLPTGRDYCASPWKSTGLEHSGLLPFVLQAIPATDVIEMHRVLAEILPFHSLHKLIYAFLVFPHQEDRVYYKWLQTCLSSLACWKGLQCSRVTPLDSNPVCRV